MRRGIPQRKRIYLGCEGESEQSYGKLLGEITDAAGLYLYWDCDVLQPGGGDPLALVQLAIRHIKEKASKRGSFIHAAILLDRDTVGKSPDRDAQILPLANKHKLNLIWQNPCHEGFLLRHLDGQTAMRPQSTELANQALKKQWPEYYKGMPARELASRIDRNAVGRAVTVEHDLSDFLKKAGLTNI